MNEGNRVSCTRASRHAMLEQRLKERLLSVSYSAFQQCALDLLEAMDYTQVHQLGRKYFRGRNQHGGAEIAAYTRPGATKLLVIAGLKHFRPAQSVQKRFVDELRGAMVRSGAKQGLLITTGTFSPPAREAAALEQTRAYPIKLVDGDMLASLLVRHRVGIYEAPGDGRLRIKRSYFDALPKRATTAGL